MIERPRVLIVDDELGVRESLRAILGKDCEVLTASSGDEALATVGRETVDLVTLDLRMPGLGGIAVLERIKKVDPEIEALIITGYGSLDTAIQGLRHHAFDYISKPFDCDQVRIVVQAALARRVALKRLRSAPEQILATLSHEFRTPLNVIMGYSTMLRDENEQELSEEQ
ncbi:MAG: response regulator, partial [Candidatus Binatia bacterium]